ncbi:zinc finger protein 653-like [Lacerta agilis]|uniref:zinc finger protein 653-like n=1 Tax=Lacerta agilis TaxID=80427 RepID=UPI001419926F|nr:zinc finger protein 653-like [Lacerta agilis]
MSDSEHGPATGEEDGGEPEEEEEEEAIAGDGEPAQGSRKARGGQKARGRPRLTESDRAQRRLESRKKYDMRRVYLGESHGPWSNLRQRSGWSDAKLAAYLLGLEREQRAGRRGKLWERTPYEPQRKKRRRRNVNSLKNIVIWYEDHKNRCPYEPHLSELDPTFEMYTTAVWQCEAGHRYFQDLHSPLKPLSDSENDGAGSSGNSDESSSSEAEEQPESRVRQPPESKEAESASGLITRDGIHIPFEHHIENLAAEQGAGVCHNPPLGGPQTMETVVCVPVPVQMSSGHGTLFDNVTPETLSEVVASCPVQGVAQGSQVIIIAGPGYDALTAEGIQLNVTSTGGEELPCAMIEGVTAYAQTEPENGQPGSMEAMESVEYIETKRENEELFELQKEEEPPQPPAEIRTPCDPEPAHESGGLPAEEEEAEGNNMSSIIYEIPKEPEKRRRSKRGRVMDADGMLEMFHCPYEGCTQVYVALSSFQNHVNLVHRKGKTKVCPHPGCGKKFYLSNHLRRHMIIHSGVREFTCETCGKSFKRKNHLEVHRRTHTGETPLQCEICGYQCRQRASLNWHMKKHTSEAQYNFTCEHCGKRFEKLDSVKFHKLKSHPDHKAA